MTMYPDIPEATYRLQFHHGFRFHDATAILDYLAELGVSHVYASPFFQASRSSTHGYDVADHNALNPALGDAADFELYIAGLKALGLRQVLDFVPNHMGISEPMNRCWMDVLENGPSSLYADFFDIEWQPIKRELENKVLLPILGDRYGRVLENGQFRLHFEAGAFFLRYYEAKLPLNPRSYPLILRLALERLKAAEKTGFFTELLSIVTSLDNLPTRAENDPDKRQMRAREKEVGKRRLERVAADHAEVRDAIEGVLRSIEGGAGDAASFDRLDALLDAQVYRLSYWRVAAEEINYRRFFDINSLAAIRIEVPEVFEEAHRLVFDLLQRGAITALRIDHVDGLWDPQGYLAQLQERCAELFGVPAERRALFLLVEKILGPNEALPGKWPVHGTTGYEFTNQLTQLLIDRDAEAALTETYVRFTGDSARFADVVYDKKRLTMRMALASEVAVLGHMLDQLSEKDRNYRDFTLRTLSAAVLETIACFPVYRTYVTPSGDVSETDRQNILRAIAAARRRNPHIDRPVFEYLARVLLLNLPDQISEADRAEYVRFVLKFQQVSGPVMAKGVEDTAFYCFLRLVALNEVGGEPGCFGRPAGAFHQDCAERLARMPHTVLATSTHDTKRSEDVRARIVAISEIPAEWRGSVQRWARLNREYKTELDGELAPSAGEEYLLYQTLAGAWPLEEASGESRAEFQQRIQEYLGKAIKEAKVNSSWIEPNEAWEEAVRSFVARLLDPVTGRRFLKAFHPVAKRISELGAVNSLAQTVLKCTTPGVPDIYQGTETWNFSLVDPDNRRSVDFQECRTLLAAARASSPGEMLEHWPDGRIKVFVLHRLLSLRRTRPDLFRAGSYQPLEAAGRFAESCFAFLREHTGASLLVVVPRLSNRVGLPPIGSRWKDTALALAESDSPWTNVFTGETFAGSRFALADALRDFPVGVFVSGNADGR
ncbi:MAG: malto-oligosyltrehalose synthase [Verrucomicrobiota bacterium]|nr:malto-oligosyltrehalose synthase [Verrucomicrobiota bacterium]